MPRIMGRSLHQKLHQAARQWYGDCAECWVHLGGPGGGGEEHLSSEQLCGRYVCLHFAVVSDASKLLATFRIVLVDLRPEAAGGHIVHIHRDASLDAGLNRFAGLASYLPHQILWSLLTAIQCTREHPMDCDDTASNADSLLLW